MEPLEATAVLIDSIAAQEFDAIAGLLAEDARLRALVPARLREEEGRDDVVARLRFWFGDTEALELLESDVEELAGRVRFRYRLRGREAERGWVVQEQSGYVDVVGGRIAAIDLVCSGDRPIDPPA